MRTHYCGDINETLIDQTVTFCGWVHRRRDHGGVIFLDVRDREVWYRSFSTRIPLMHSTPLTVFAQSSLFRLPVVFVAALKAPPTRT